MAGRYEIRFSGAGGQGLILAGVIMAEAASIYDGIQAVQSQSYGPEARGGASKSEVIISDETIDYPKVTQCDALLALTQEACDKYSHDLKEGGVLLIDSDLVLREPVGNFKVTKFNITNTAKNEIGREIVTNIVALGAMVALTGVVTKEAAEKAVLARVPEAFLELNKKAFHLGYDKAMAAKA
ncbi:2-oxoacid:acceptor oxidoreductase family protein [Geobacter hydrogenophilus]|uniref:2-oxoglutarate ferredoxin oxidoreductase subunit gamma n=1 Tax=Geobacter hydrogenophilus TaxID=40983 RepID=A0A9W6FXH4_9BACT|nr:2-oxoacid:acceptor oxidoreductase family protein [Geobacter hydrogenophilus]MBT0895179.1 2-oxoacid:acceptor oxidoreductase family protein [Geobacter hydrogenophilus]GLI36639.1 2-oxoglutarate ferredoxin oxidoreductase subunit gamma [Geobacter hydrogenophilus]